MNTKSKFLVASSLSLTLLASGALSVLAENTVSTQSLEGGPLMRQRNASSTRMMRNGLEGMKNASSTRMMREGLEGRMKKASSTWSRDLSKMIERGDKEIDRRIEALKKQGERIQSAKRVSDDGKSMIATGVQSQIDILTALRAKIDADTDEATLKTDLKSITASHRIFALIMPQAAISAAADRIKGIANDLNVIAGKVPTRITAAQTVGKDVTAMNSALSHMNLQIADALVQADAAIAKITGLVPDNGDKTKASSNKTALITARADIKVGTTDLQSARKDLQTILGAFKSMSKQDETTASPTSTVTPTTSPTPAL